MIATHVHKVEAGSLFLRRRLPQMHRIAIRPEQPGVTVDMHLVGSPNQASPAVQARPPRGLSRHKLDVVDLDIGLPALPPR